jgi:hypothetical protein
LYPTHTALLVPIGIKPYPGSVLALDHLNIPDGLQNHKRI